ncbi:MAG: histidine kinase dimerization/phospho-acceptor domain-containing protein, partial [Chloroflexota bacterium]
MRIAEFLITSTYAGFIVLFVLVAVRAVRYRGRANLDALFFFGVLAALSIVGLVEGPLRTGATGASQDVRRVLALALPVLLLRLLDGFTPVSARVFRIAIAGYALSLPMVLAMSSGMRVLLLIPALYFLGTLAYAVTGFVRFAGSTSGVTRRRMQAIGVGTLLLMFAGLISAVAEFAKVRGGLSVEGFASVVSFATGVAYYIGIAPPAALRRIWQYGALTDVLRLLAVTPASMPIEESAPILNRGIAAALGAPNAAIMVWDESQQALVSPGERLATYPDYHPDTSLVTHVFRTQRADYFEDAPSLDPANAALYRRMSAYSVLVAPIRTASGSVGVLTLFSSRAALFSCDDVPFAETVAEQVAAFFVRHELVQQAVAVEAQTAAMRLKEDFLAAAAHDLRTPLTGILGRAQLLLRRAEREPGATRRVEDLRSLVEDGKRMQRLTEGLLEVSRLEHGFSADLVLTDLRALVMDTVHGSVHRDHRIVVDGQASAMVDAERFRQVVQNLVDNAVKFSPGRLAIRVLLEQDAEMARV